MKEIVFYGRGGHGAVMASEIAAIAAYNSGANSQAFPFFGGERRGAPVKAFLRIDSNPIMLHSQIYTPDIIVVLDAELLHVAINEISLQGLNENGTILINGKNEDVARVAINEIKAKNIKAFYIDAISIAVSLELVVAGWPVINTVMLGALANSASVFSFDALEKAINEYWPQPLAEKNVEASKEGFNSVKKVNL
ncbi:MAG: 2-oxoacid:acceptor oxidoreductase family protein [Candidatus Micrarchaeaceae archaeon]